MRLSFIAAYVAVCSVPRRREKNTLDGRLGCAVVFPPVDGTYLAMSTICCKGSEVDFFRAEVIRNRRGWAVYRVIPWRFHGNWGLEKCRVSCWGMYFYEIVRMKLLRNKCENVW